MNAQHTQDALKRAEQKVEILISQRDELLDALRPLITKRMSAEQIREGIQRAIASAAIDKAEGGAA